MAVDPAPEWSARPRVRTVAIVLGLVVLCGLFVAAGALTPNPELNDHPGGEAVGPDPGAYVGQEVSLGGQVVGTDPVRVEVEYGTGKTFTVTVTGVDRPMTDGDHLSAFGTLKDEGTLAADRVIHRQPWELSYMYVVSFVAGLWVLARTVRRWRFDADRLGFVPREGPISIRGGRDA